MLRSKWTLILALALTVTSSFANQSNEASRRDALTPKQVLKELKKGNQRYLNNQMIHRDFQKEMLSTKAAQFPTAIVLSCMDSRNIPYLSFDQGIGDIFSIRVAGNVLSDDMLASMEYATKVVGAKLIVVMGHTRCGAVAGACEGVELGHITGLVDKIKPAIKKTKQTNPKGSCKDYAFIDEAAKQNVMDMVNEIPKRSPIIEKLLNEKKIAIVAAMYDIRTGKVTFFDKTR